MPRGAVKEKKKGLHGWRAFLAIFASGTIAAFLVMGIVVGALRLFVSTVSSGVNGGEQSSGGGVAGPQMGSPLESIPPGKLNICDRTFKAMAKIRVSRVDSDDDYRDDALEGGEEGERIVSDDCEWELTPEYTSTDTWDFKFTYYAVLQAEGGGDRKAMADSVYEDWRGGVGEGFKSVEEEGEEDFSDRGYAVYGVAAEGDEYRAMTALVQTRSAVYMMQLSGRSGEGETLPRGAFEYEINKMVRRLDQDFRIRIPE